MTLRRSTIAIMLVAASVGLAGCSATTSAEPSGAAPSGAAPSVSETTTPSETAGSSEPAAAAPTSLMAVVGTDEDPDAFEIALTDESGTLVTTLPAGDYSVTFVDRSAMHNFSMTGPGDVDISTDVAGTDESTVEVTLVPGTYDYVCDPHVPTMNGSLEVTG